MSGIRAKILENDRKIEYVIVYGPPIKHERKAIGVPNERNTMENSSLTSRCVWSGRSSEQSKGHLQNVLGV